MSTCKFKNAKDQLFELEAMKDVASFSTVGQFMKVKRAYYRQRGVLSE